MKIVKFFSAFVLISGIAFGILSCSDDDNGSNPVEEGTDIVDIAAASPDLGNLVLALERANLVAALEADGPFTVFAPTNTAFNAFLADNNYAGLEDVPVDVLTQVLLNHVVSGENLSSGLTTGYISSLSTAGVGDNNLSLFVDVTSGVAINGVAEVITADIDASNGVIHVVDAVIGLPNIVDHAVVNPELSSLVGALTSGGNTAFTTLLSDESQEFTVFAPSNAAFSAFTNPNSNDLDNILSNHVLLVTAVTSGGLVNSYTATAATNSDGDALSLYINTDDGVVLNGVSSVGVADIIATNGVIHTVDAVIDIPTVVTFAVADPAFSTLVTALTTATPSTDFVSVLNGDGPFTVLAPTDSAFQDLLNSNPDWNEVADIEEGLLTSVLQHHVVSGNIRSEDLTDGVSPVTLEGDPITINLPGTGDNIADVTDGAGNTGIGIVFVNAQAGNGVIHSVNTVLIPDTTN